MDWTHLLAFNLTLLAAMASPGPAMLFSIRATLSGGMKQGLTTGAGLAVMAALWTTLALLGLDSIFAVFPWAYMAMKLTGALYLLWIAFGMWRDAAKPIAASNTDTPHRRAFVTGMTVNLANPKSVLFASAVLLVIFPQNLTFAEKAFVVGNHLFIELCFYSGFALLMSTSAVRDRYLRLKPILDRAASVVLGALGVRLLLDRS